MNQKKSTDISRNFKNSGIRTELLNDIQRFYFKPKNKLTVWPWKII